MKRLSQVAVVASLVALAGCYHGTIETGLTPSAVVIDKSWASGWLWGLVPPSTIETASKCPQGVAKVETQLSFLNTGSSKFQVPSSRRARVYTAVPFGVWNLELRLTNPLQKFLRQ